MQVACTYPTDRLRLSHRTHSNSEYKLSHYPGHHARASLGDKPPSLGSAFGLAVFVASTLFAIVAALAFFFGAEDPEITYTCNPEQPHLSVKECVR